MNASFLGLVFAMMTFLRRLRGRTQTSDFCRDIFLLLSLAWPGEFNENRKKVVTKNRSMTADRMSDLKKKNSRKTIVK